MTTIDGKYAFRYRRASCTAISVLLRNISILPGHSRQRVVGHLTKSASPCSISLLTITKPQFLAQLTPRITHDAKMSIRCADSRRIPRTFRTWSWASYDDEHRADGPSWARKKPVTKVSQKTEGMMQYRSSCLKCMRVYDLNGCTDFLVVLATRPRAMKLA